MPHAGTVACAMTSALRASARDVSMSRKPSRYRKCARMPAMRRRKLRQIAASCCVQMYGAELRPEACA
jgi:hypothetical protein